MQKLLITQLSAFQAEILFWLQIAAKQRVPGITLDLSTLDIDEDEDGEGAYVELSTVVFQLCIDGTWRSVWRYVDFDEDGDPYVTEGDVLISGQTNPCSLVMRTISAMAVYFLDMTVSHELEKLENESETYAPCRRKMPDYSGGYCGCWQCRHSVQPSQHIAKCVLCRSIGRTVEKAEAHENQAIPF